MDEVRLERVVERLEALLPFLEKAAAGVHRNSAQNERREAERKARIARGEAPRKRGRPIGSKNRVKGGVVVMPRQKTPSVMDAAPVLNEDDPLWNDPVLGHRGR